MTCERKWAGIEVFLCARIFIPTMHHGSRRLLPNCVDAPSGWSERLPGRFCGPPGGFWRDSRGGGFALPGPPHRLLYTPEALFSDFGVDFLICLGTRAGVKSWKGVETTSAPQARSHGEVMGMQCPQAPSVLWTSCEHAGRGLRRPPKKEAEAEGRGRLFYELTTCSPRRVLTKSKNHSMPAGTASP